MRLTEQETYLVDGERQYAGIWIKNTEGLSWASHRGQTDAQFLASFAAHRDAGLMPIDYDEYDTSAGLRFNSAWVQAPSGTSWKLYRGLSSAGFSQRFAENSGRLPDARVRLAAGLGQPALRRHLDREHQRPRLT